MFENVHTKRKQKVTPSVTRAPDGNGIVLGLRRGNSYDDGVLNRAQSLDLIDQINTEVSLQMFGEQEAEPASVMEGEPVTEIATPFTGWPVPAHLVDAAPVSIL